MRLIVSYTDTDGYTYSCQNTVPVEYESAEQLLLDISLWVSLYLEQCQQRHAAWAAFDKKWRGKATVKDEYWEEHSKISDSFSINAPIMKIGGAELYLNHFIENEKFYPPCIQTVDEWFKSEGLE